VNYYDFFVHMLREERDMQLLLKGMTTCGQCDRVIDQDQSVMHSYSPTDHQTLQDAFCSETCAVNWEIARTTGGSLEPRVYTPVICHEH
jgi:hypothetical protein